jgi:uncharacterized cupredoxin-like copper-binding protein
MDSRPSGTAGRSRRGRGLQRAGLLLSLAAFAALCAAVALGARAEGDDRVTVRVRYSAFEPAEISVKAGEPVTFVLRNDDPIEHEWMVGGPEMHEAHRSGTEAYHDTRPTEVTLPPLSVRETTVVFEEPGEYEYICHLPGHEAYGMKGVLRVE